MVDDRSDLNPSLKLIFNYYVNPPLESCPKNLRTHWNAFIRDPSSDNWMSIWKNLWDLLNPRGARR